MTPITITPIVIAVFSFSFLFAQETNNASQLKQLRATINEHGLVSEKTINFNETPPPLGKIRNIAEWESMESVLIAYDNGFGIPISLIVEMSQDTGVTTIVANASEENYVTNLYASNGVNLKNCSFIHQDPNTNWTRDYSPWYIAVNDNEVAIVDFPYNRPRPNDNNVPSLMADELNISRYGMDISHTGGNYMCDGYGVAASSDLVLEENTSLTQEEIDQKLQDYLGIETYQVALDPLDDYIKHIDCWGKFLDVDKVLITEVPVSDYRYDDYEAVASYYSSQNCSWGYPYEVIRVQAADYYQNDINPYTNSLILNNKVFVPQTGSDLDDDALAVYEANMPGYEIFPVYSSSWINSDALHCRTHGVADTEMLFIKHFPLHSNIDPQSSFSITADVFSYGGSSISTGNPKLYYQYNNSGTWEEIVMTHTTRNTYTANIPGINGEHEVAYYIAAENENGKSMTQPQMGAIDPHIFSYTGVNLETPDILVNGDIRLYPNPSKGEFFIKSPLLSGKLNIYNISGQLVFSDNFTISDNKFTVSALNSGVYVVKVESGTNTFTKKLVIE